jgi:hypothetical protein
MQRFVPALALVVGLAVCAGAQDVLEPAAIGKAATPAFKPDAIMTDPAIRKAVRDTLLEIKPGPLKADGQALRGDAVDKFSRQVDEAQVPSCWRSDAMKHQPPKIGPISLAGLLALPFWGAAIVSGKCNK